MDAVKYLKERERWYKYYDIDEENFPRPPLEIKEPEQSVKAVEQWSKEHPAMTNAQKFEEAFGFNAIGDNFTLIPVLTPHSYTLQPKAMNKISDWKSWWQKPYKEPEGKE